MTAPSPMAKPARPPLHRLWVEAVLSVAPSPPRQLRAVRRTAPRGDGHPVLVVPAFLHHDVRTLPLRRFLQQCGYVAYGWRLGINVGPTEATLLGIERRLAEICTRHGRTVSLIGHSLGGAIARELAKTHPEQVRQLITLASPIRLPTASPLEPLYTLLSRWHSPSTKGAYARLNEPPPVPVTALYTRRDGILAWQSCLELPGERRESIEIRGAHGSMSRNAAAWRIIADRLAQAEGSWRPYGT